MTAKGEMGGESEFFRTPSWVVDALLDVLPVSPRARVLDAGCGDGAIMARLIARGVDEERVVGVELDADRAAACKQAFPKAFIINDDFLTTPVHFGRGDFEIVITNPPFSRALEFVERGMHYVGSHGVVAMLQRLDWLGSTGRAEFLEQHRPDVHVLSPRPRFYGSGDSREYGWFVFSPTSSGRWRPMRGPVTRASSRPPKTLAPASEGDSHVTR